MLNLALVSLKCLHLKIFFSWNKWFSTNFTRFGWSYNSCERTGRTGFFVFLHFKFNLLKNFCEVNQVKHFIRFKTFKVGIHDRFLFYFIQFYPRWQNTKMIDNYKKPLSNHLLIIPQRRLSPSRNNAKLAFFYGLLLTSFIIKILLKNINKNFRKNYILIMKLIVILKVPQNKKNERLRSKL